MFIPIPEEIALGSYHADGKATWCDWVFVAGLAWAEITGFSVMNPESRREWGGRRWEDRGSAGVSEAGRVLITGPVPTLWCACKASDLWILHHPGGKEVIVVVQHSRVFWMVKFIYFCQDATFILSSSGWPMLDMSAESCAVEWMVR